MRVVNPQPAPCIENWSTHGFQMIITKKIENEDTTKNQFFPGIFAKE
jgi:hypothetical protein